MQQEELIPNLFRTEYRKIVSVLCKLFGIEYIEIAEDEDEFSDGIQNFDKSQEEYYDKAVALIKSSQKVSTSFLQRNFPIGYNRAAKIIEQMEKDGFGENPIFHFFVAEAEGGIIGISLYYIKYSTWKGKCVFLEDIIVTEKFRKSGIGKKLFDEVVMVAKEMKVHRLEWQVLEWNEPAIKFYEKLNSNFDAEWINCKLNGEQIQEYKI